MKIAWIGTGVMGQPMAGHLLDAGHELRVANRTKSKAQPLLDAGATWCESAAEAAGGVDVAFTIVGYPADVEQVYLGEDGILRAETPPAVAVDMTTSDPSLAQRIAKDAGNVGTQTLDAPVSGGDKGAKAGTLAIMAGGNPTAYDTVRPLFDILGGNVALMGPHGAGQHTKMCNQILIAGTMAGVCESLLYAERQGLDMEEVIAIIGKGAAGSWAINNIGPRIARGDYAPGFYVEHFVKDMDIALRECANATLALPGLALVHQLYTAVKAEGFDRHGTQALMKALRRLNGMDAS